MCANSGVKCLCAGLYCEITIRLLSLCVYGTAQSMKTAQEQEISKPFFFSIYFWTSPMCIVCGWLMQRCIYMLGFHLLFPPWPDVAFDATCFFFLRHL